MDRRKYLRAYVRTDKRGKIVPGSLTLLNKLPRTPGFKEVITPGVNSCYCGDDIVCSSFPHIIDFNGSNNGCWTSGESLFCPVSLRVGNELDNECNMYSASVFTGGFNFGGIEPADQYIRPCLNITKTNKDGVVVWTRLFYIPDYNVNNEVFGNNPEAFKVDDAGNSYLCYQSALVKIDADGTLIWVKVFDTSQPENVGLEGFSDLTIINGTTPVTTGYYDGEDGYRSTLIIAHDPISGDAISSKAFYTDPASGYTSGYGPYVVGKDGSGNILGQFVSSNPAWATTLVKMDSNLNVIWSKVTDVYLSTNVGDMDSLDITTDKSGNIFMNGYGNELYKLDPNGNTLWTCNPEYGASNNPTTPDGGVLWLDFGNSYVYKVSADGNLEWIYDIQNPTHNVTSQLGWDMADVSKGTLLIGGNWTSPTIPGYAPWQARLLPTDLSGQTAGSYNFVNYSGSISYDSDIVMSPVDIIVNNNIVLNSIYVVGSASTLEAYTTTLSTF